MKLDNEKLTGKLGEKLDAYQKAVPARNPKVATRQRAAFMAEAEKARAEFAAMQAKAVPTGGKARGSSLRAWLFGNVRLTTAITTVILVIALLFGGAGVTLAAAQNSMPDEPLYGLKLWSEDARMELTTNEGERVILALAFADRRMAETTTMLGANKSLDLAVQERYQATVTYAFRLTAGLDDDEFSGNMQLIQERLQVHEQLMAQLQLAAGSPEDAAREQVRQVVRQQLQLADSGLVEPEQFRLQFRQHVGQDELDDFPGLGDPGNGAYGPGPYENEGDDPGDSFGPQKTVTPTPGGGYGPGTGPQNGGDNGGSAKP